MNCTVSLQRFLLLCFLWLHLTAQWVCTDQVWPLTCGCTCREHALRKRRSRSARHHWQRHVAVAALSAWRQLTADAASFRGVLHSVGRHMRLGLLSEAFLGWRDVIRAKQWKEANMMRWGSERDALLVAPVAVAADGSGSVNSRWSNVCSSC